MPWLAVILASLREAGQGDWVAQQLGQPPVSGTITPIPHASGHWDGGLIAVAASPDAARVVARSLNAMCIPGAAGTSRLAINVRHDYSDEAAPGRQRPGKGGRGARPAGRLPAH